MKYHVREFVALSGNTCRVKIWPKTPGGLQPVEGTWSGDASLADVKEFDAWYRATAARDSRSKLPLRLDLAGGWLDVPRFARPEGYVVNLAISPLVEASINPDIIVWTPPMCKLEKPTASGCENFTWNGIVPVGSGLGTSAAWHMLNGRDVDAKETEQGSGWQDAAVIRQTGLCVWQSGPKPVLLCQETGNTLAGRLAIRWLGSGHDTSKIATANRDLDAITRASLLAYQAVASRQLEMLADAINQTYEAQLAEGMDELPVFPSGARNIGIASKYCGSGWGGYAMYLFEDREFRDSAVSKYQLMPVEPYFEER